MNAQLFLRIKRAFERNGGVIAQDADAQEYLRSRGAEAATFNQATMILKVNPSSAEVFEELIHTAQFRTGRATGDNVSEMEAEAAEKLIRHHRAYKITHSDVREIIRRLRHLRHILEEGGIR